MTLAMAAWASFARAKPPLIARRRSSVSTSLPPHFGQVSLGLRSTQNLLLQASQRCAWAMPVSTLYSQEPARSLPRWRTEPLIM